VIRFQCEHCGKPLVLQGSGGAVGTCPHCKKQFRVPGPSPAPTDHGKDAEDTLLFSQWGLRKGLVWFLGFQLLAFVVMVGSAIGCVVVVLLEPLSFRLIYVVIFASLVAGVGLCYCLMLLPNWRLFFFSTIPSSSRYVVTSDRLVRYGRADGVVEQIPFANIAAVRLLTRRNVENPEITAKIIGIDLKNHEDRATILDRQFCLWSQKMHRHDLVLINDFFEVPLKTVFRTIKRRWQLWQETHPLAVKEQPPSLPRRRSAWYQTPLTYTLAGLGLWLTGLVCLGGLAWLVNFMGRGHGGDNAAPAPGEGPAPLQVVKPAEPAEPAKFAEQSGPRSVPGLVAYWPCDEGQGKALTDASGNGSHGRVQGGQWIQGPKGSALRLGGKGDFVDLGSERQLNFGPGAPFTLAGWVATESNGVICSFRNQKSLFPIIELSVRQGHLNGWVRDDTSGFGGAKVNGASVNDGKWHHVALLREGDGTIELFLEGASQGRSKGESSGGPITTDLRTLGCDRFLINKEKAPGYLAGDFHEFCVYNRALAVAEVSALAGRK
jgi:hypothetical protein